MALRGEDQFYMTLTSDGSLDINPDNKSSAFRISLKEALEFTEQEWEVAVTNINYPYSWTNLGPTAKTFVRYYIDNEIGPQEINFPDWLCERMEELVDFMSSEIWRQESEQVREKLQDKQRGRIQMKLDELRRFKLSSMEPKFDIAFSESMMHLLGLQGHPMAQNMSLKAFARRQRHRDFLDKVWKKDMMLDYTSDALKRTLMEKEDLEDFAGMIFPYVDMDALVQMMVKSEKQRLPTAQFAKLVAESHIEEEVERSISTIDILDEGLDDDIIEDPDWKQLKFWILEMRRIQRSPYAEDMTKYEEKGMARLLYHLTKIQMEKPLPKVIRATIPGNLNPIQRMFVYTNIIYPVDFNDSAVRLLKMINTSGIPFMTTHEEFLRPTYLPVQRGKISMIDVYITDYASNPVPFQVGTVIVTLHFQRIKKSRIPGIANF